MSNIPQANSEHPEIIDLEEYSKAKRDVPLNHQYQIRIDLTRFVVDVPKLTGRGILYLVHKSPEEYLLHQRFRDGSTKTIEADDVVDFTGPGPERFMTMKRETQEGFVQARKQFKLSAADEAFLNATYLKWEAVLEGNVQWIVIYGFPLPCGFTVLEADLAIQLVAGYPDAALDMAYFRPELRRSDGKNIPNVSQQTFDGSIWQQWSRHRTSANQWVAGVDDIATHVAYAKFFLAEEFKKR